MIGRAIQQILAWSRAHPCLGEFLTFLCRADFVNHGTFDYCRCGNIDSISDRVGFVDFCHRFGTGSD